MGDDGCQNDRSVEEELMCAQVILQRVKDERDTARRVAIEALRLMTPEQASDLRRSLGDLDIEGSLSAEL